MTGAAESTSDDDLGCLNLRWALALLEGMISAGLTQLVFSPGARSTPLLIAAQRLEAARRLQLTPILDERSAGFFALGLARASLRPVALLATSGSAPAHWYPAVIEASETGLPLLLLSADRPPRLRGWGANQTIDQTALFGAFVRESHDPGLPPSLTTGLARVLAPGLARTMAAALKAQWALGRRAALVSCGRRAGPVHLNLPFDEPLVPGPDCTAAVDNAAVSDASEGTAESNTAKTAPGQCVALSPQATLRTMGLEARLSSWPAGRGLILCGPVAELRTPVSSTVQTGLAPSLWPCANALALPVLVDPLSGLRSGADPAPMTGDAESSARSITETRISAYDTFLRNPALAQALRPDWVLHIGRAPISKVLGQWLEGVPSILVSEAGVWSDPSHDALLQLELPAAAVCDALRLQGLVEPRPDWLACWTAAEQEVWRLVDEQLARAGHGSSLSPSGPATPKRQPAADGQPVPLVSADQAGAGRAEQLPTLPWSEPRVIAALRAAIPDGEALFCANSMPIRQLDSWWRAGGAQVTLLGNRGASGIDGYLSTLAGIHQAGLPCWGLVGDLSLCHDLSGLLLADRLDRPLLVLNNGGGHIFDYLPQRGLADFERLWQTPQPIDLSALAALAGLRHWRVEDVAGLEAALSEVGLRPGMIECVIDPEVSRQAHLAFWEQVRSSPFPGSH